MNEYISDVEDILGHKLESGYNDRTTYMRLTFNPVVTLHRPLVQYFVTHELCNILHIISMV